MLHISVATSYLASIKMFIYILKIRDVQIYYPLRKTVLT